MRTRDVIEGDRDPDADPTQALILEVLLDVRELLQDQELNANRCGHGGTGLCMACVIQNDLLRLQAARR